MRFFFGFRFCFVFELLLSHFSGAFHRDNHISIICRLVNVHICKYTFLVGRSVPGLSVVLRVVLLASEPEAYSAYRK